MDEIPTLPQFLKWLALALLGGLIVCGSMTAFAHAYGNVPFWGELLRFGAKASFIVALASNAMTLVTITVFWGTPDIEHIQPHARASLFLTTAQTIVLVAMCMFCGCAMSAFVALAAAITLAMVVLFVPGSLLPPLFPR